MGPPRHEPFEALVREVREAPFGESSWSKLVEAAIQTSGGWCGHLLGFSPRGEVFLQVAPRLPIEALEGFEPAGGGDPARNPRALILTRPDMTVIRDGDVVSADRRRRLPFFADFCARFDGDYAIMARLSAPHGANLVLAGLRSGRQGEADDEALSRFRALIPHVAASVRLLVMLEEQGEKIALGALESIRVPAFLVNAWGALTAATPAGDEILKAENLLRTRGGRLEALDPLSMRSLESAFRQVANEGRLMSAPHPIVLRDANGSRRLAELSRLPAPPSGVRLGAAYILVLTPAPTPVERSKSIVIASYGLTDAEADIALQLGGGVLVEEIAHRRRVRPDTIRTQLKSIFSKVGASGQVQLVSIIRNLVGETKIT